MGVMDVGVGVSGAVSRSTLGADFKSPRRSGRVVGWSLRVVVAALALSLLLAAYQYLLAGQLGSAGSAEVEALAVRYDATTVVAGIVLLVYFLALLTVWVSFLVWFRRAYRNLPELGAGHLRFKRGWALGAWFVPILSLVRPKAIMDDIWRASHGVDRGERLAWRHDDVPKRLHVWWGAFLTGSLVWQFWSGLGGEAAGDLAAFVTSERTAAVVGAAAYALYLLAAVILLGTVKHVTALQDRAADRLAEPAVSGLNRP